MTAKAKVIAIVAFLAVYGLGCLWLGHHNERLEWVAHVAKTDTKKVGLACKARPTLKIGYP